MKNFYPDGRVMPKRKGSVEPARSRQAASNEGTIIGHRSIQSPKSVTRFNSYRKRGRAGSPPASTSNLYDVLKRVDWLAIFSPWAIINRSKMYATSTKQYTSATRTPANNAALKDFLRRAPLRSGLAIVRGSTTVLPKIFMVRRAHHDIKPNTCATRTPANNAALKGLAIATGGTTVVPKIFSGEFYGGGINSKGLHELASRGFGSFFAEKKERPVAASDGKVAGRVNTTLSSITIYSPFPSTLHLLLPTIFVSVFICFSGAAKAQSRPEVGAAEAVKPLQIGDTIPEELWNMPLQVVNHPDGKDTITLNDYRDKKLIILDFWATWCAPCIKSLKSLDVLQRQYLQDMFVLPVTQEQSVTTHDFIYKQGWLLPSSVDNTQLKNYFPYSSIPHKIWIRNNIFIAATGAEDYGNDHVMRVIGGLPVGMRMKVDTLRFDPKKPLIIGENGAQPEDLLFGSIITKAINTRTGGNTYRPGHLLVHNASVFRLYMEAFAQTVPFRNRVNRVAVELPDDLRRKVSFENNENVLGTEADHLAIWKEQNMYSFSLSVNESFSKPELREVMQNHLNQYFGKELGIIGKIERRLIPVLALVSTTDKSLSQGDLSEIGNSANTLVIQNKPVDQLVSRLAAANWKLETPIVDQSGISSPIYVTIAGALDDLPSVKRQLRKVGLDLVNSVQELEILVITTI